MPGKESGGSLFSGAPGGAGKIVNGFLWKPFCVMIENKKESSIKDGKKCR